MKVSLLALICFLAIPLSGQDSPTIETDLDTLAMADTTMQLVFELIDVDEKNSDFQGQYFIIDGVDTPLFDTTVLVNKYSFKEVFYSRQSGTDILYSIKDGKEYVQRQTGYLLTQEERINILKKVYSKIQYPKEAIEVGIEDKIRLEFYVDKNGCFENFEVRRGYHKVLIDEAVRAAKEIRCEFPTFKKGNEQLASVLMLPVTFKLRD